MRTLLLLGLACTSAAHVFKPDHAQDYKNPDIPALVDFTESQYDVNTGSSYWISSFITGRDGNQYLALAHILTTNLPSPVCRSSILDLRTNKYWVDLTYCQPQEDAGFDRSKPLVVDYGSYAFGATSEDSVSSMYAYAETNKSFALDLRWEATSKSMLNGGAGIIAQFGQGVANATEWGLPACNTEGTITVDSETIKVDPMNSFTWYDRQISHGTPKNWTWFNVNFPGSEVKASIWAYDFAPEENRSFRFGTIRIGDSFQILSYTLEPDVTKTWTSPNTGITYPLRWTLKFDNGDYLYIESVRDDQEMYGDRALADSAYEGFITVKGKFFGQKKGFGVAELVSVY